MKVKVLSLLVPALLVAGAANAAEIYNKDGNKLDLYGKIDGLHYFSSDDSVDGDQTYMRIGVKGETQINDQLTGYGQWEYNVQANNTESSSDQAWTRLAFAGLKFGDAGSFDYGRNYGVVYDVTSWTDVLPEFGGDTYGSDNFLQSRANGVATYRNSDFFGLVDGLNFALQYQGKNGSVSGEDQTNNGRDFQKQNGEGFGTSVTYDITKSTCWTTTSSLKMQASLLTTLWLWAWFTSSKQAEVLKKAPAGAFFYARFNLAGILWLPL